MYGLSTAWKSGIIDDGKELLKQILETGVPGLELDYRVTATMFEQMRHQLSQNSLSVLSLHNYFPLPETIPKTEASADAYRLSATNEEERKLAVKYTQRTLRLAHELKVPVVVLHLGQVDMETDRKTFRRLYDEAKLQTPEGKEFLARKFREREQNRAPNWEAVLRSLEALVVEATKLNIILGIENRYFLDEIPDYQEIGLILQKFKGGPIRYWHDVGHAQVQQYWGIISHEQLLATYSSQMVGIHLQDCLGYHDHDAPGAGEIDFDMVKKYLPEKAVRIIEVHPKVSLEKLQQGIKFLKEKGIITTNQMEDSQ